MFGNGQNWRKLVKIGSNQWKVDHKIFSSEGNFIFSLSRSFVCVCWWKQVEVKFIYTYICRYTHGCIDLKAISTVLVALQYIFTRTDSFIFITLGISITNYLKTNCFISCLILKEKNHKLSISFHLEKCCRLSVKLDISM